MKVIVEECDIRAGRIVEGWQGYFWMIVADENVSMPTRFALMHPANGNIFTDFMSKSDMVKHLNTRDTDGIKDIHNTNVLVLIKSELLGE